MPDTVKVRPATKGDLEQILDLNEAVAAEGRWIGAEAPIDRDAKRVIYESLMDGEDSEMFVAETDGRLVGVLSIKGKSRADLGMYVSSDARGQGIGTALVAEALDWARKRRLHKIALEVWPHNEPAIRLYRRFGFEQEGYLRAHYRRKNGELWDSMLMGLLLDASRDSTP